MSQGATDRALYFAYGSNLLTSRLRDRVPSARALCPAFLDGHRVAFGKLSRDGSGKATLVVQADARVWGAVYSIDPADWPLLDRFEPGYERVAVSVVTAAREALITTTYLAPETAPDPVATASYKNWIITGAREHRLPDAYIETLLRLPERPDSVK